MLPLAQSACWKAGCVLTKVVRPTALPTLLTAVSSRKCEGKRGVRNSQETHTVYSTDVVKRKRCKQTGGVRWVVEGVGVEGVAGVERWVEIWVCRRRKLPTSTVQRMQARLAWRPHRQV